MNHLRLALVITLSLLSFTQIQADESPTPASARFNCQLTDWDTVTERPGTLDFISEVNDCSHGCLTPIIKLETSSSCRDFTASFDFSSNPKTLDVSLWSYCGRGTHPDTDVSQTVSIPTESTHFQLTAAWGKFVTVVKCQKI